MRKPDGTECLQCIGEGKAPAGVDCVGEFTWYHALVKPTPGPEAPVRKTVELRYECGNGHGWQESVSLNLENQGGER